MDAILISWKPEGDEVKEIINHLAIGREYYWRLKFRFSDKKDFDFPVLGYVPMKGGKVEYKVTIQRIIPFSSEHYKLVPPVIPESWIREWNENPDRREEWKTQLVITKIEPFSFNTYDFRKRDGGSVRLPPRNYTSLLSPEFSESPI